MNIYDCFMYFDEDLLLDLRLNILNKYVKKFIITEATYAHNGSKKKLNFDIRNFSKFKDKITYIVVDTPPPDIKKIKSNDSEEIKAQKLVYNGYARDIFQRQNLSRGLDQALENDIIIISDLDEVPNLENIDLENIKNKIIIFKQKMFYYKLNLVYPNFTWFGSKACKKKKLSSPQWLRNIKSKKYSNWRIDLFFSKKKYINNCYIENGGWHFTNIRTAEGLEKKLLKFAHHFEYEESGLNIEDLKKMINEKKVVYDHAVDQKGYKWSGNFQLKKIEKNLLPTYVASNIEKYKDWLD